MVHGHLRVLAAPLRALPPGDVATFHPDDTLRRGVAGAAEGDGAEPPTLQVVGDAGERPVRIPLEHPLEKGPQRGRVHHPAERLRVAFPAGHQAQAGPEDVPRQRSGVHAEHLIRCQRQPVLHQRFHRLGEGAAMRCQVGGVHGACRYPHQDGDVQVRIPGRDRAQDADLISAARAAAAEHHGEVGRGRRGRGGSHQGAGEVGAVV